MPSHGADLRDIGFRQLGRWDNSKTLVEIIATPDEARAFFDATPTVVIRVPVVSDRRDLFLGRFDRKSLFTLGMTISVGRGPRKYFCEEFNSQFERYRQKIRKENIEGDSEGWVEIQERAREANYIRLRPSPSLSPDLQNLACDVFGSCGITACSGDALVLSYGFNIQSHPKENLSWLIEKVAEIKRHLLGDDVFRGAGE